MISFVPDGEFYKKKAMQAFQRDRFADAHKYFKRAIELSPKDASVRMHYGVVVMEEGRFEEAYELLMDAQELNPNNEDIVFYLAEVHAHLGMLRDAKLYAEQYIALQDDGPWVDEAMEIIEFAQQEEAYVENEDSLDSEVYFLQEKARRYMEAGQFNEAVDVLEAILTDHPDVWAVYNNLALAYFYIGKEQHATELLYDVLDRNKGNLHALCNLAVIYYYEKREEKLAELLELLLKIKPYQFEHRYKLGATLALIGQNKEAFHWLRSLQKRGFDGDAGYYFWLAHSAYFSGHEEIAREAFAKLVQLDPTKEGYEPWAEAEQPFTSSFEHDREFLLSKIKNKYQSERMFGFYLLGKSGHKQEIIAHPAHVQVEKLSSFEQLFLAHSLNYDFNPKTLYEKAFSRALETTDLLYNHYKPLDLQGTHLFQMWFTLCEQALNSAYIFRNPAGLAAAADYMFQSSRYDGITKKAIAEKYVVSVPTLTKYVGELMAFLPHLTEK